LLERFGKLNREQVLAPAIAAAEQGVMIDARFRMFLDWRKPVLEKDEAARRVFFIETPGEQGNTWEAPPVGHILKQPELASTLKAIAKYGAKVFYKGAVAKVVIQDIKERGGILSADDLSNYKVRERKPLLGSFMGHAIATAPLPSAGGQ